MRYTWAQFRTYLRLARRRRAEDRLAQVLAATAPHGGAKTLVEQLQAELKATAGEA